MYENVKISTQPETSEKGTMTVGELTIHNVYCPGIKQDGNQCRCYKYLDKNGYCSTHKSQGEASITLYIATTSRRMPPAQEILSISKAHFPMLIESTKNSNGATKYNMRLNDETETAAKSVE
jgi:hypothetical protein